MLAAATLQDVLIGLEARRSFDIGELLELVVPLFALANAGISVDRDSLAGAVRSPVALGIVAAYVVGKPVGIIVTSCR